MTTSFAAFLAGALCAFIVIVAALTAWLDGQTWNRRVPPNVRGLFVWAWVFVVLGCVLEVAR